MHLRRHPYAKVQNPVLPILVDVQLAIFSTTVQKGSGAHLASYAMGTGYLPGLKRPERVIQHTTVFSDEIKERLELYDYSTSGISSPVIG
jgi:hypothetical protein